MPPTLTRSHVWLTLIALLPALPAAAVTIDGVFDPQEWAGAEHFTDFVAVQPLSGAPAPTDRRAEAWMLSTPEGLAFAVRAWHPPEVPQTRTRIQRDGNAPVDRMNVMIDFDADGRVGYDFTITAAGDIMDEVVSNESSFNSDWDAAWTHAVADFDGGYVAEWLIPWSIAQMRNSGEERRTVAVYFDRVLVATGERFAFPDASFNRPRFVSDFHRVEIDQYQDQQLALTPYVVSSHDFVGDQSDFKGGLDVFWKPSGDHQFALTLNPDFGQVESDELVVDFSGIETFFTDKRPFFTENQSYFELNHFLGRPFYTRRVGGPLDDGSGAAEIRAAVKANGSFGRTGYGVFAAEEDGDAGRSMQLLRGTQSWDSLTLGAQHSRVERPFLDREAEVTALDARWKPSDQWLVRPLWMHSRSDTAGISQSGNAAGVVADWDVPGPWRQQYFLIYSDARFELNDLGFQDRNDYRYLEWETGYRQDALPPESRFASHSWEGDYIWRENTAGELLQRQVTLQRYSELRSGSNMYFFARWRDAVVDDRLSRGNGSVPRQSGPQFFIEANRPRRGDGHWSFYWNFEISPNHVDGLSYYGGIRPRWHASDRFDVDLGLFAWRQSDWLLWQEGREFGSFSSRRVELFSNLNWFIDDRQELRVKLQAIAIDAEAIAARRLDERGRLVASSAALEDFQLRNLGFQIRYRYKLGTLSDIYAVYSRGGFSATDEFDGLGQTLEQTFSLRDSDQFLVKLAYRFDW
ncbi:MAG: hypothetical protein KDI37_10790 [Xanthomonadales bacterium]|nr:hypothetical protein [Xanthomonadales bacterium]